MRITALASPAYWFSLTPADYQPAKEVWEEKIYQAARPAMPDFREHILDIDMFTPQTIKRFTGHQRGCVYGAEEKILPGTTPLKNLYLCGTDQGFLGIIGSMLSGITMANNHCLM
jgi:phytoene dehydrogenase-like protein